jgi:hypothetical protein
MEFSNRRIAHDYMNVDMQFIEEIVINNRQALIGKFLAKSFPVQRDKNKSAQFK